MDERSKPDQSASSSGSQIIQRVWERGGSVGTVIPEQVNHYTIDRDDPDPQRAALLIRLRDSWGGNCPAGSYHFDEHPDLVAQPLGDLYQELVVAPQALPVGTTLGDLLTFSSGTMLLLCDTSVHPPTVRRELACAQLTRAEFDSAQPVPVLLDLARWAVRRPLADWIIAELLEQYGIPTTIAHGWLLQPRLLPLLGGLEDLPPRRRLACLNSIDAFRDRYLGALVLMTTLECYLPLGRVQISRAIVARHQR